ncbi:MAG: hypothetical protein KDD69_10610 [Bdellovibrionales bacterium]|nr:hypothetical protein [Bdellovibrionales bacterium]
MNSAPERIPKENYVVPAGIELNFGRTIRCGKKNRFSGAAELAHSLIGRSAVPEIRWRYFTDPKLNIGTKRSRLEVFEQNGTTGDTVVGFSSRIR